MASSDVLHMRPVLRHAWEAPFTCRSNVFRENAEACAKGLELGLLTLQRGRDHWTNIVRVTPKGLAYLDPLHFDAPGALEPSGELETQESDDL